LCVDVDDDDVDIVVVDVDDAVVDVVMIVVC